MRRIGLFSGIVAGGLVLASPAFAGWGENWGTMVWGAAPVGVPTLGLLGFGLLSLALAAGAVFSVRRRAWTMSVLLVALAIPLVVAAGTVSVPYTFTNGTPADADEINANFDELVNESNDQDGRLGVLETAPAVHTHPGTDITTQVGDADTVDGVHAADLEESAEIVTGILTHTGDASAHHQAYTDIDATDAMGASDIANSLNHARYTDAEARAANHYRKTAVVALSSGDYTDPKSAMDDIAEWCGSPSATNPCLLRIMPGIYDLGNQALTMQAYVDIEGSGENTATVTSTHSSASNDEMSATLVGADNAEVRFLTVENQGGGSYSTAIYNLSASPKVTNVTATASGGTSNSGVYNYNSSPTMTNVTTTASGGTDSYGVYANRSSPVMTHITATASSGTESNRAVYNDTTFGTMTDVIATAYGGLVSHGVYNNDSSPEMTNVTATASGGSDANYGILNQLGSHPVMTHITATSEGGTNSYGMYNSASSPTMRIVSATALDASSANYGIWSELGSGPKMTDVSAAASGDADNYGVYSSASFVEMTGVIAKASVGIRSVGIYCSDGDALMTNVRTAASGGTVGNWGLVNDNCSPTMMNVHATASGGTESTGVYNLNAASPTMIGVFAGGSGASTKNWGVYNENSSSPTMTTVIATASGGGFVNFGIQNGVDVGDDSSPTMANVTATGSGTGSEGVRNQGSLVVATITNSRISGDNFSVRNLPGATAKVATTMLKSAVSGAGGSITCVGVFDENFSALDATCQ